MTDDPPGDRRPRLVGTFATGADRYERLRPDYPLEAVRFCVPMRNAEVVDVGAGTGKFTRSLVAEGHRVIAVEPSADMRSALALAVPGVRVHDATAERTGLPDGSVDVATFAQSWHWTDVGAASAELQRIVRPGGYASMVWTMLDDGAPWVERVQAAMHSTERAWQRLPGAKEVAWERPPRGAFGRAERHTVAWSGPITLADLVALVTTRSYYLEATPDEQQALLGRVRDRVEREFPTGREEDQVELPYVTTCLRYQRLP